MIEAQPPTRFALQGLIAIVLGAGWAAFGILGCRQVLLAIVVALTTLLSGGAPSWYGQTHLPAARRLWATQPLG